MRVRGLPARANVLRAVGIGTRRQHTLAYSDRRGDFHAALAHLHCVEGRDGIRAGRNGLTDIDPRRGRQRRRRIGAGVGGEVRAHGPAVEQRQRPQRTQHRARVAGKDPAPRGGDLDLTRRHRLDQRIEPDEHLADRRQLGDPLRCIGLRDHRNLPPLLYCHPPPPASAGTGSGGRTP